MDIAKDSVKASQADLISAKNSLRASVSVMDIAKEIPEASAVVEIQGLIKDGTEVSVSSEAEE